MVKPIAARPRPFTAGRLCAAVAGRAPAIGRATVFRTLELLEQEGVLDRRRSVAIQHSFRAEGNLVEIFGRCPEC